MFALHEVLGFQKYTLFSLAVNSCASDGWCGKACTAFLDGCCNFLMTVAWVANTYNLWMNIKTSCKFILNVKSVYNQF